MLDVIISTFFKIAQGNSKFHLFTTVLDDFIGSDFEIKQDSENKMLKFKYV